jgi:pyruvate/2-oxoglutarate dehydrogenase complex dihydrolipoamide dehydrogenase (E3) component
MESGESEKVTVYPEDQFNRELVENAHPEDWVNPEPRGRYNLVIIGAGTAGLVTAAIAVSMGAKVALVEKHLMGGDCLNVGCVPSKGLIRAARAYADVRDAGEFGVIVPDGTRVDFPAVMERMRRLRARISPNDSVHRFKDMGVDIFLGSASFTGRGSVEVGGKELRYAKAVITTGARAIALPIPGLQEAGYLTNETLFSLTELPKRLAVIGAGPIGCEMSQSFARFGSEVWLLERMNRIMPREDEDIAKIVEEAFVKDGVNLVKECDIRSIEVRGNEKVIHFGCGEGDKDVVVDEILVGVGRAPNVKELNLESVGVEYDERRGVNVDEYLQTTNKRIFAAGDICFPYKFTHTAESLAGIVIQNALFMKTRKTSTLTIPWCTYTDPEVAHVGLHAAEAEEKGIAVQTFEQEFRDVDRAILDGEDEGLVRIHTQKGSDKILGATIVARHAGEMISEITLAINGKLGAQSLVYTIHPYPTQADSIKKAAAGYMKTKLTPLVKKLLNRWLTWKR